MVLTLRIEEIGDRDWVGTICDIWRLEHLLHVRLGLDAHVLLAKCPRMLLDIGMLLEAVRTVYVTRNGHGDEYLRAVLTAAPC